MSFSAPAAPYVPPPVAPAPPPNPPMFGTQAQKAAPGQKAGGNSSMQSSIGGILGQQSKTGVAQLLGQNAA